jgi:hypothetical protein
MTGREVQEALQDLITSPGWLLFKEQARQEYGASAYGRRMRLAVEGPEPLLAVKVLTLATDEVNALVGWPEQELKRLGPTEARPVSMSRGGR